MKELLAVLESGTTLDEGVQELCVQSCVPCIYAQTCLLFARNPCARLQTITRQRPYRPSVCLLQYILAGICRADLYYSVVPFRGVGRCSV